MTENEETKRYRGCEIVQATLQGIKNPVQEYGSSLTYCRRYSLLMALGLATEDNDAQDLTISTINTKEDALKMTINFGKYKGKTLNDIQDDENYLEWLFDNSKDENMVKAVSLITGWETKTDDQMKEAVKLLTTIKDLMSAKNIFSEELIKTFGKKSNEMTNEELKEVIKWLESYDKLGEK